MMKKITVSILLIAVLALTLSVTAFASDSDMAAVGTSEALLSPMTPDLTDTVTLTLSGDILRYRDSDLNYRWERRLPDGEWERIVTNSTKQYQVKEKDLGYQLRVIVSGPEHTSEVAVSLPTNAVRESTFHRYTIKGTLTSYIDSDQPVHLQLIDYYTRQPVYYPVDTTDTTYSFSKLPEGISYSIIISKKDHLTREYDCGSLSSNIGCDIQINPFGDVSGDGKVTAKDYAMANAHVQYTALLSGYRLLCGDVLKADGKITAADAARINAHVQKTDPLW